MTTWTAEFYEDSHGKRPVEKWMHGLGDDEFAALRAGIVRVLEPRGLGLAGTAWLKALGDGLYEFQLRLFVHFHGQQVILILHGYDKGRDDSPRRQNKEIQEARKRLRSWKAAELAKRKR